MCIETLSQLKFESSRYKSVYFFFILYMFEVLILLSKCTRLIKLNIAHNYFIMSLPGAP